MDFIEELKEKLKRAAPPRRSKEEIRERAKAIWEEHGRPAGKRRVVLAEGGS
jgi:hypothetical protein